VRLIHFPPYNCTVATTSQPGFLPAIAVDNIITPTSSQSTSKIATIVRNPCGLHQLKTAANVWEHIHSDALGGLRVVTDNAAAVLESRNYGIYGDLFGQTGTQQAGYGYTGEPTDSNGLVYGRARYMSPAIGQFLSLDPLETFNRYAYGTTRCETGRPC
jgi:RHS repeat-associated protein